MKNCDRLAEKAVLIKGETEVVDRIANVKWKITDSRKCRFKPTKMKLRFQARKWAVIEKFFKCAIFTSNPAQSSSNTTYIEMR